MAAKQTNMLLGRLVEHQDCFDPLSTRDTQWAIQNPKDAAAICITAIKNRPKEPAERAYKILHPITPTSVVSLPFRINDTFLNKQNSRVKIAGWGFSFDTFFRNKEEMALPVPLQIYVLNENAYDHEIMADLGGEDAAEIAMIDFWEQIVLQGNGESGALRVDGWANIGYAKDAKGALRTVRTYWGSDGWYFSAREFPYSRRWNAGFQVVSPLNS